MKTFTLKNIYSKNYLLLIAIGFLPLLWKILEIAFLSSNSNALKILGQIALISIIFKVFEESILNPLFKMFSKNDNNESRPPLAKKFLIYYSVLTVVFTFLLFIFSSNVLQISHVPDYIFDETLQFVQLYIIANGVGVIVKYLYTFNLINKDNKKMFVYFLLRSFATAILFVCLVPSFSMNLGVNGIALSELIINLITFLYLVITFPYSCGKHSNFDVKKYLKLFFFSFVETLIRNVVYYFVILVFLNMLDNQDLYFVSNEYIWSVMLVPTLAQSTLIKQDLTNDNKANLTPYFVNSIILAVFILLLIPLALLTFKHIYNLPNYLDYFFVLLKLVPCYFIFIFDSIAEAYFIATGKLHHILIQSILTNIIVYVTALILFLCGVWKITLDSIIILFNLGVVISSLYTITAFVLEKKHLRKIS